MESIQSLNALVNSLGGTLNKDTFTDNQYIIIIPLNKRFNNEKIRVYDIRWQLSVNEILQRVIYAAVEKGREIAKEDYKSQVIEFFSDYLSSEA